MTEAPATAAQRRTCYRQKACGHQECREEWNRYQRATKLRVEEGRSNKIPVEVAARVIAHRRRESGITSVKGLAEALGVHYRVIKGVEDRTTKYVHKRTLERLSRPLDPAPTVVPALGTMLRLRALQAEGWRINDLAALLGCSTALFTRYTFVRYETAVRVVELMELPAGTSHLGAKTARTKGCRPREDYDQDTLRDPLWDGQGGLVNVKHNPEEARVDFWHLVSYGVHPAEASARVGRRREWAIGVFKEAGRAWPD